MTSLTSKPTLCWLPKHAPRTSETNQTLPQHGELDQCYSTNNKYHKSIYMYVKEIVNIHVIKNSWNSPCSSITDQEPCKCTLYLFITDLKNGFYLHLLKPPLDDPLHGRVKPSNVSCILTAVHWTPGCWQNSRGQGGPSNEVSRKWNTGTQYGGNH